MNHPREVLAGSLCITLLATAFCVWSVFGNDINICISAGCSLYQDFTVNGISLWWIGAAVFSVLALMALVGAASLGRLIAGAALCGDICLLLLMALTAPCVSCLVVALFFAASYTSFRFAAENRIARISNAGNKPRSSVLLWIWLMLFTINIGSVARSQTDVWPIIETDSEVTTRLFFSPSCSSCREAVGILSGHVDVAFYPLGENEADLHKIVKMRKLLDTGASVADALAQAQEVQIPAGLSAYTPELLLLRFKMLRNKAHVYAAGSQVVPFFEYQGIPAMLKPKKSSALAPLPSPQGQNALPVSASEKLPLFPLVEGRCTANTSCP
ncbi:MAG: hypothetical protein LBQ10_10370 [Desulfovibrio sp.]|jgi:glutaredoxin-related protein|nr:hypothetical protein [Desulfovibrio sp.]